MRYILDNWAVILLSALAVLLVALICETSWPVAYVYVVSIPSNASVFDGEGFYWTTPAKVPVGLEGLSVTVSSPGRVPVDTLLTAAMSSLPVEVHLPYRFGLSISSDPPGACVEIDGQPAGRTPLLVTVDEPGRHTIRLELEGGAASFEESFTLVSNRPDTLHYDLPRTHPSGMLLVPGGEDGVSGLEHTFLIARHEVTNGEFCEYIRAIEPFPVADSTKRWGRTDLIEELFPGDYPVPFRMDEGGRWTVAEGYGQHPVAGISFRAALGYCEWLSERDTLGLSYRLPTESEWRAAALAGTAGPWPWGAEPPDGTLLNLSDVNEELLRRHPDIDDGYARSSPVGSYAPNSWGLFDMAGNVWEYCLRDDGTPSPVALGGGWLSSKDDCRADSRMETDPLLGYPFVGFRTAADPEDPAVGH